MEEAAFVEWIKKDGDEVKAGEAAGVSETWRCLRGGGGTGRRFEEPGCIGR